MTTRLLLLIVGLSCALVCLAEARVIGHARTTSQAPAFVMDDSEGRAPHQQELQPSVEAAFRAESYAPQTVAKLAFFNRSPGVGLQVFRVGAERARTVKNEMRGVPVTRRTMIGSPTARSVIEVRVGSWPSGVYFARLDASDGRLGFAPFVVRPRRLGEHRVAVVMPTFTWQAYNIRDDDKDGTSDSWYGDWRCNFVRLYRPYLNRGVPYHFRTYDLQFLHWLVKHDKQVDFLADTDSGEMYLGELNPRVTGASSITNVTAMSYGDMPLFLFHLLEFMDVDFEFDVDELNERWAQSHNLDEWTQFILKQTEDVTELITQAPRSGIWRMRGNGQIAFARRDTDWHTVADETEAFYLRIAGVGQYRYPGADLGIMVTRGRFMSEEHELLDRARQWITGIKGQFSSVPPGAEEPPTVKPEPFGFKML